MVYRYSWLVGSAASILAFTMLNSLLKPTTDGLPWQIVVGGGLILGVVISWTTAVYRLRTWMTVAIHTVLMFIVMLRIGAPDTLNVIIPTVDTANAKLDTFAVLDAEFTQAFKLISNGVEPVVPLTGIVIIVTLVFWTIGALMSWGLSTGHPFVGLLPPFVVTLQFATMDRQNTGIFIVSAFVVLALLAILAITRDEETGAGRMYRRAGKPDRRRALSPGSGVLGVTVIASLLAVALLTPIVPRDGILEWRNPTGLTGDFFGSVSYNPFVGINQFLVDPRGVPVFSARIDGEVDPSDVYFRLVTMDTYSTGRFFADDPEVIPIDEDSWEFGSNEFFGSTEEVTTTIRIAALAQDWLPAAYAPTAVDGAEQLLANLQIRPDDAAIHLDGLFTVEGLTYSVTSDIPRPDIAALAANEDGELSRAFIEARDIGDEAVPEIVLTEWNEEPATVERYLALPDSDVDNRLNGIGVLAREVTDNLETDFERALALETWFHSPFTGDGERTDGFAYTTDIRPGQGASDLADWLLDADSPNYHQGYCENFATAMGVMARTLGIPSRIILGFTPGISSANDPSTVIVTDNNAHAWVELWMPSQGWVRFDPTPRSAEDTPQTFESLQETLGFSMAEYLDIPDPEVDGDIGVVPQIVLDGPSTTILSPAGGSSSDAQGGFSISLPSWLPNLLWFVAAAALLFGSIPFIKWNIRRRRIHRLRDGDISAAWEQLVSRLTDLHEPPRPTATATEVADDFDPVVLPLATVYERSLYGPEDGIGDQHVETAVVTLDRTEELMSTRYSRGERLRAVYRPGTILPGWWKRLRTRNR